MEAGRATTRWLSTGPVADPTRGSSGFRALGLNIACFLQRLSCVIAEMPRCAESTLSTLPDNIHRPPPTNQPPTNHGPTSIESPSLC
jgi:hypothetical protein